MELLVVSAAGLVALIVSLSWRQQRPGRHPSDADLAAFFAPVGTELSFRFPRERDAATLIALASDPVTIAANGWPGSEADAVAAKFATPERFEAFAASELVAIERYSGDLVGTAMLQNSNMGKPGSMSIGLQVHPDHRKKGYGRQIMAAAILLWQSGLREADMDVELYVGTAVANTGMKRIMEQLGYEPEPETHTYDAPNGEPIDSYWYRCGPTTHTPRL